MTTRATPATEATHAAQETGPPSVRVVVGALAAAPYAIAVLALGLRTLAQATYPRALGVRFSSDLKPVFPDGGVGIIFAALTLVVGFQTVATLVGTVRQSRSARWLAIGWLVLAVPIAYRIAWHPDRGRRCFVDGYRGRAVCASATSVTIRDFVLLALPAIVAIACFLAARTARPSPDEG